jgi:hypothetical protein
VRGARSRWVDAIVLIVAAYLQAAVFVRCARVFIEPRARIESSPLQTPSSPSSPRESGGAAILARNPFESASIASAGPCRELSASIVSASRDAAFSLATLRSPSGVRLVRNGSRVDELEVVAIGERTLLLSGSGGTCRVALEPPRQSVPTPRNAGDGVKSVPRALRDRVLSRPERLLVGARVIREPAQGIPAAFRIERLEPGALLETLGLRAGDRIRSVNGLTLSRPEAAVRAWAVLSKAESFRVSIERDGKPLQLHVRLD